MTNALIDKINSILSNFKLNTVCIRYEHKSPFIIFDLMLMSNIKISKLKSSAKEIGLALRSQSIPLFEEDISAGVVRMIVQISKQNVLYYKDLDKSNSPDGELSFLLGKSANGENYWMDLAKNPHMLVAGTTGSGKSSLLHVIIANALERDDVELYVSDPKSGIEFGKYSHSAKIATTYEETLSMIRVIHSMMEMIYKFNLKPTKKVIVIIDEVADLIDEDRRCKGELENLIVSIAQKARAAKIFMILATQRPDVKILNGRIKANFPARLACKVNSAIDSRIILDDKGAENLVGKGDSLIKSSDGKLTRVQLAYI